MIEYDGSQNLIILSNNEISYVIYINNFGYLETLYFGKKLSNYNGILKSKELSDNGPTYFDLKKRKEQRFEDGFKIDASCLELSSHGFMDKRYSPIILETENGSFENEFLYVSHRIYSGLPKFHNSFSHAYGEKSDTVEILLKDSKERIYVKLFLSILDDKNILIKNLEIINKTKKEIKLHRAMSMQLDLPSNDYYLTYFPGRWSFERQISENLIHPGTQEISSNFGRSSHDYNPFVYLRKKDANNEYGEVIGLNLIYSGNFKLNIESGFYLDTKITYGINDEDFCWILNPKETFKTPQAVISYSYSGVDKMSQTFHDFIRQNLITYKKQGEYKSILFNSWEGCYFDFNTDLILSYIDKAKEIGSELFVLDDGWFSNRDNDYSGLGDWFVNKKKIDLHKAINHCKDLGMKFGLWFEPEMISYNSNLFKSHPSYCLGDIKSKKLYLGRHQFHLDFSNPNVIDYIFMQMCKILDEYEIDYIKWDYNRIVGEHFSSFYPKEQQGEIYHRLVLGYYSLLERLTNKYPDIMIEGCASGGGRFDLGTLYYCPQIWGSDESDPVQRLFINYNTSLGYPLSTIGTHVNDNKFMSYKNKASLALFGTYGYEMNPHKLNSQEIDDINDIANLYKKYHKEVIEEGDMYHLISPNDTNYFCAQCVSKNKSKSLVILVNKLKELDEFRYIKLKGLDSKSLYKNNYDNNVYTGEYYMNIGLNLSKEWLFEFECKLIVLEKI